MSSTQASIASSRRSGVLAGIGLMLLGILLFALNDAMGKWLVSTYSVGQVLLLRSVAALVVLLVMIGRSGFSFALPERPVLHVIRMVLSTLEVACFYWAVTYLPLADVMTYYLAGPIYVAAMAAVWLGERTDRARMSVVLIGFVGVLVALRPSSATLTLPALIALSGSIFFAFLMIITRKMRDTSDTSLVMGSTLGALLFGVVASPFAWVPPSPRDFACLSLLGVVAMAAHFCVNRSLKLAPASVVAPYQYTMLVWAVVFGYFVFGDIVQVATVIGAAIICGAGLGLILLERNNRGSEPGLGDVNPPILPEA
jgi:drug/metabolite transporter (DMT)-like permease